MSNIAILERLMNPIVQCLTPDVARCIAAVRASEADQNRIDELADKSSAGTLSAEERVEYERWIRAIHAIGVLQAKARHMLARAS